MKNINYITLNCFQSDYCMYICIILYSIHILVFCQSTKPSPTCSVVRIQKTPSIKLLKKLIELSIILNDHALCALFIGLT